MRFRPVMYISCWIEYTLDDLNHKVKIPELETGNFWNWELFATNPNQRVILPSSSIPNIKHAQLVFASLPPRPVWEWASELNFCFSLSPFPLSQNRKPSTVRERKDDGYPCLHTTTTTAARTRRKRGREEWLYAKAPLTLGKQTLRKQFEFVWHCKIFTVLVCLVTFP